MSSTTFEDATTTIEMYRSLLAQGNQRQAALALKGVEIHSVEAANIALSILRATKVYGTVAGNMKKAAVATLEGILSAHPFAKA